MIDTKIITGVAIRHTDDTVVCLPKPNRHHHIIRKGMRELGWTYPIQGECGFYTDEQEFLTRSEAWEVALAAGQIKERALERNKIPEYGDARNKLYSEDVW